MPIEMHATRAVLVVVKRLERRPPAHLSLVQIDPLIRDLTQYRNLIAQMIQEDTR